MTIQKSSSFSSLLEQKIAGAHDRWSTKTLAFEFFVFFSGEGERFSFLAFIGFSGHIRNF